MKDKSLVLKIAVGLFGIAVVVLVIMLLDSRKETERQVQTVVSLSNQIQQATVEITDHKLTITNLETDLTARKADILSLSNTLAITLTNLDQTQASLKTAEDTVAKLEAHNQALEARAGELNNTIAGLTSKIEEITQKLTAAEGDKAALTAELKRLTAEKEELVAKFNDLNALRAQVAKIKSDQAISKRLAWLHSGIQTTEPKAAEKMTGTGAAASAARKARYDLNVEVDSSGAVKVIPPLKP